MPYSLEALVIDRVDLVDEGANSEAFMTLYKRKENHMTLEEIVAGLKPEHASVVTKALHDSEAAIDKVKAELTEATATVTELEKAAMQDAHRDRAWGDDDDDREDDCGGERVKEVGDNKQSFDDNNTLKSLPAEAREIFKSMQNKLVAAEAAIKKAADEKEHADAVAKAATLKAIPVSNDKLVSIVKGAAPELLEVLESVAKALEASTLSEIGSVGAEATFSKSANDTWSLIEKKADELAKANGYSIQKGISEVIAREPKLYQEYLDGGAN